MVYPNSKNEDPTLLKLTTRDDEIKGVKYITEKHDHETIFESLKNDNNYFEKEYKCFEKKKVSLAIIETFMGSASTLTSSTLSFVNQNEYIIVSYSTALFIFYCYLSH